MSKEKTIDERLKEALNEYNQKIKKLKKEVYETSSWILTAGGISVISLDPEELYKNNTEEYNRQKQQLIESSRLYVAPKEEETYPDEGDWD